MSSTELKVVPPGSTNTICPALSVTDFPLGNVTLPLPSSKITLKPPSAVAETINVVPSTAADAPPDLMVPPPVPFGGMKQQRFPVPDSNCVRWFKGKNRVRADTSDGLIRRGQFGARIRAGAHQSGALKASLTLRRRRGFAGVGNDVHVFDHFSERAFGQRRGVERNNGQDWSGRPGRRMTKNLIFIFNSSRRNCPRRQLRTVVVRKKTNVKG